MMTLPFPGGGAPDVFATFGVDDFGTEYQVVPPGVCDCTALSEQIAIPLHRYIDVSLMAAEARWSVEL